MVISELIFSLEPSRGVCAVLCVQSACCVVSWGGVGNGVGVLVCALVLGSCLVVGGRSMV